MATNKQTKPEAQRIICQNKRARHDYAIARRLEAGLVLRGTEVKACRAGAAQINEAYVQVMHGEAFLIGSHIAEYRQGNRFNHVPERSRKLLLHKNELEKLEIETRQRGHVAIPLALYFKDGRVKLEVGVGTGKTHEDRREDLKEREVKREMDRARSGAARRATR